MAAAETCRCCRSLAELDQGICAACGRAHGFRVARLLARCQAEPDFASTCLSSLAEPARSRFAAALSAKCLASKLGPGLRSTRPAAPGKRRESA